LEKFQSEHINIYIRRQPSLEQLIEIAKILGVVVKDLIVNKEQ